MARNKVPPSNDSPCRIPPTTNSPNGCRALNSAESLFTHKLKHSISVAPVPVHSEKQGNYLERAHLGNSAHRRRVGASRKLRAHTEYAEKTFTVKLKKGGISKKEWSRKAAKSFLGGGKPCSFITSWTWRVSSTLRFWGWPGSSGDSFVVFVLGVDWQALGKGRKREYCGRG